MKKARNLVVLVMLFVVVSGAHLAAQTASQGAGTQKAAVKAVDPVEVMHIFDCITLEGKTDAQVEEAAKLYLKAIRQLDGGKDFRMKLLWPVAVSNMGEKDFNIVVIAPSFTAWGKAFDGYTDDTAAAKFEDLQGTAQCSDSALWEATNIDPN
jgi:hypothetical protein